MLIIGFSLPGIGLILFGYMLRNTEGIFGDLPWGLIGGIFFICAIAIVRWRGHVSTGWKAIDFPTIGEKLGVSLHGAGSMFETLHPSIAGFLKAGNTGRYYKDDPDGSYGGFAGHDVRLIDREVAYCTNPEKAILVDNLSHDGFYDWETIEDAIKKKMVTLSQNNVYVLTGTTAPPNVLDIDIHKNQAHKELFDYLIDDYFIKVHGRTYSLKHYHRFQEKQAAPIQVGIIIYYAKALAAMRAARVKTGMGSGAIFKLLGVVALIVMILVAVYLVATGQIAF